jgi:hypothetical protein
MNPKTLGLEDYFIRTNFYDLLPIATQIAKDLSYSREEMVEAICKVYDKYCQFPPTKNRTSWFRMVFKEKLGEARGDFLSLKTRGWSY